MKNRIEKVNSLLEHEVSKIILKDFDFSPEILVTLIRVEATANLIEAKAYISVFFTRRPVRRSFSEGGSLGEGGPDKEADKIIAVLNKNVFDIQQKINRTLRMRPVPKIRFVKDEIISHAGKIEELLGQLKKEEK